MSIRTPLGAVPQSGGYELAAGGFAAHGDRVSSRRGLIAIAGVLAAGFVIAVAAAHTATLLPESIRPVPSSLSGVFGRAGLTLPVGATMAVLILMFVSYAVVLASSAQLSARVVLMTIAALHAVILLAPPLVSTDVFSYQAYARMGAVYGTNPYLHGPHAIALDSIFPYIGAKWSYIPSVYGPAFTVLSYVLAPLSVAASVFAYKSIAALASLALVAVVWQCARLRGTDPVKAAALVGLNPLLVLYGVGGGHNDLLMLAVAAGAVYAILASRERLGGGMAVLAIGLKLTGGLVLPFAIAAGGSERERSRRRDLVLGAGVALALVATLSFVLFGTSTFHLITTLRQSQSQGNWLSIPGHILTTGGRATGYVLAGSFVIVCGWLLRRVWHGRIDWLDAAGWAMLAMLVASSSLLPWYVAWLLPLAALAHNRRLLRSAIVLTGVVQGIQLLGYVPHSGGLL